VIPNLLVPDLAAAVQASRALKIYVCNLANQPGETDGYSCGDHIRALEEHGGGGLFDLVVINRRIGGKLPDGVDWVQAEDDLDDDYLVHRADLIDEDYPWRHDSGKLAQVLIDLLQQRTGPLVE
jgi:uncharacterized cofD-like protein